MYNIVLQSFFHKIKVDDLYSILMEEECEYSIEQRTELKTPGQFVVLLTAHATALDPQNCTLKTIIRYLFVFLAQHKLSHNRFNFGAEIP